MAMSLGIVADIRALGLANEITASPSLKLDTRDPFRNCICESAAKALADGQTVNRILPVRSKPIDKNHGTLVGIKCVIALLNSKDLTAYKFDYSTVGGSPEILFICLK
jgi:hypothetical protein